MSRTKQDCNVRYSTDQTVDLSREMCGLRLRPPLNIQPDMARLERQEGKQEMGLVIGMEMMLMVDDDSHDG